MDPQIEFIKTRAAGIGLLILAVLGILSIVGLFVVPSVPPTPTLIPTLPPTFTPAPPPEAPVIEPAREIMMFAGNMIAIRASAIGAEGYRWELQGDGEISTTGPGGTTLYIAPEQVPEGGAIAVLAVTAYNEGGESAAASLIISIAPFPPSITITSPLDKVVCPLNEACHFDVSGTSFRVATDPNAQVIVFVRDGDLWFPYKRVTFENEEGGWHREVAIGDESCLPAGYDFEIVALAMAQDQITEYPTDPQPYLPEDYIARSNSVYLETTYEPVSIDLRRAASRQSGDGNTIAIIDRSDRSLTFDYHLEGGWAHIETDVHSEEMACMKDARFSLAFSLECTGAVNTFEIKLEDADGTSCVWRGKTTTDGSESVEFPLSRPFDECWGGDGKMNWQQVKKIIFAVAHHPEDEGGEGRVSIGDITMWPLDVPSPPPPPEINPANEAQMEAGRQLPIHASAAGAEGYRWELLGNGSLSTTGSGDTTVYTAPEEVPEGGAMVQLNVTAYNSWGESPPTSLIISILNPDTKSAALSTLAIPAAWLSGGDPDSYIQMGSSPIPCEKTEAECLLVGYATGGDWGGIYWWPLSCGYGTEESWNLASSGICGINVYELGGFSEVTRLTFWVRGAEGGERIEFKIGGQNINPTPGRSLGTITLSTDWEQKEIDLRGMDLSNAVGLFSWWVTDINNPEGAVFYLNDIRFEGIR